MIFDFVVRRLHWLSAVPAAPQVFDALLLAWTASVHRERLKAMEALEDGALQLPGVRACVHRFGGMGFAVGQREFAHLHGNGLLDVQLTRELARSIVAAGHAGHHHRFGPSAWVSFQARTTADIPSALRLLALGVRNFSIRK